jgi:hypothetical protein
MHDPSKMEIFVSHHATVKRELMLVVSDFVHVNILMITLKLSILSNPWILSDQGDVLSYERTPFSVSETLTGNITVIISCVCLTSKS